MALIKKTTKKYLRVKESETTFQCAKKLKLRQPEGCRKVKLKKLHPLDKKWVKFCYC